jgi:2,4-dienoyl-CoA reductase-like NADH-dependent reductase (Old Yellow Enzyme family)
MIEYHTTRAKDLGLIQTQGTVLDHPSCVSPYARLLPASYDAWRRIADESQAAGCPIVMQIYYDGRSDDPAGFGPSGLTAAGLPNGERGLTRSEIDHVFEIILRAARMVKKLGFNGIELHGGQTYFMGLFLSPIANQRDDEYGGGSIENRMRLPVKLTKAVRDEVGPDFLMGYKVVQWAEDPVYRTPDELKTFLTAMNAAGMDYYNGSTDKYWEPVYPGSPMNIGGWVRKLSDKPVIISGGFGLDNKLRDTVDGMPANATVHNGFDDLMRQFHNGEFDMFSLGRTILCDPDYLKKLRDGRFDEMMKTINLNDIAGNQITFSKQVRPAKADA